MPLLKRMAALFPQPVVRPRGGQGAVPHGDADLVQSLDQVSGAEEAWRAAVALALIGTARTLGPALGLTNSAKAATPSPATTPAVSRGRSWAVV